mmetsp:Transcript_19993/g.64401  ORF Transcript_19993/g.64401 Transcript_19993/m.64401 type:complete len:298 (+) Transcript_19993:865-1758(+)
MARGVDHVEEGEHGIVFLEGVDLDARSHDFRDARVLEVEDALDHGALLGLDAAALGGPADDEAELLLGDGVFQRAAAEVDAEDVLQEELRRHGEEGPHGPEDDGHQVHRRQAGPRDLLGVVDADGLGQHLAEEERRRRQHPRGHRQGLGLAAQEGRRAVGEERRRQDVGKGRRHEDRRQRSRDVHVQRREARPRTFLLGELLHLPRVQRRDRHLRRVQQRRQREQRQKQTPPRQRRKRLLDGQSRARRRSQSEQRQRHAQNNRLHQQRTQLASPPRHHGEEWRRLRRLRVRGGSLHP